MPALVQLTQNQPLVVTVGSVNMDYTIQASRIPAKGETILGHSLHRPGGGKGANAAIAAAHCGAESWLIAALGMDSDAQFLESELRQHGVNITHCCRFTDISTGAAFITVDPYGDNAIVVAIGANASLSFDQVFVAMDSLYKNSANSAEQATELCLLINAEIPYETVLACLDYAYKNKIKTVVNPAPMTEELITQLKDKIWPGIILTPNETETMTMAEALDISVENVKDISTLKKVVYELSQALHVSLVTTLGAGGVLIADEANNVDEVAHLPAIKVQAVDTVGAGDAFNGYLATAISDGRDLITACAWAMQGGAQACTYRGAWPALKSSLKSQT